MAWLWYDSVAPRIDAVKAVVVDVGWVNGLAAIRSLGRAGIEVVAVDYRQSPLGFRSRYLASAFKGGSWVGKTTAGAPSSATPRAKCSGISPGSKLREVFA